MGTRSRAGRVGASQASQAGAARRPGRGGRGAADAADLIFYLVVQNIPTQLDPPALEPFLHAYERRAYRLLCEPICTPDCSPQCKLCSPSAPFNPIVEHVESRAPLLADLVGHRFPSPAPLWHPLLCRK